MSMEALSSLSANTTLSQTSISLLKTGMNQQSGEVAQLLQSLPPAPMPAHLGQHVNALV